jgi:protein transport protein SEC31
MGGSMGQSVAAPPSPKVEAKPAAPRIPSNISIASADVSQVAADLKPVIACLTESYNICAKAYEGNPGKKREVDDNSRRLGILFFKLNMGDIKPSVKASLLELCKALSARDFVSASKIHISLTTTDFDECGQWLTALKRIIKTRQQVG